MQTLFESVSVSGGVSSVGERREEREDEEKEVMRTEERWSESRGRGRVVPPQCPRRNGSTRSLSVLTVTLYFLMEGVESDKVNNREPLLDLWLFRRLPMTAM
jgi:hypothetical protein